MRALTLLRGRLFWVGEVVDDAESGFAGDGEVAWEGVAVVGEFVELAAVFDAEGEVRGEEVVDADAADAEGAEVHGRREDAVVEQVRGGGVAVFGEKGEHAGTNVDETGEAGGDVLFGEVGEAELVDVGGDR